MPDRKGKGKRPTKQERDVVFAPHESPHRQADGDPGRKPPPRTGAGQEKEAPAEEAVEGETAGGRGQGDSKR